MFDSLTERLNETLRKLRGSGRLTEDNIKETLREVRKALLEADVALPVVKVFIEQVRERAVGKDVLQSLTPGQALIKVVHDELVTIMGSENSELNLNAQPPVVVLMAGLQGAGKTTSVAKLGLWLKERQKKSVMVVSTDVYRPAAIEQLKRLANETELNFFPSESHQKPVDIAKAALKSARKQLLDVVIIDTAGRLHIDEAMMAEIQQLHQATAPTETLFVVDSMTGQDAANTARAFGDALPLTGVVLTKTDGDARGGAALSVRHITGKPIKFMGVGEKVVALEPFYPDRIASRLLDMGDVLSLVEEVERKVDRQKAQAMEEKFRKGRDFDLEDFLEQLQQLKNLGGIGALMDKLPGMNQMPAAAKGMVNDQQFRRMEAIINSMTPQERRFPAIIKGSRKKRIAAGSGTQVQDVNQMLKQFTQMQKTMRKMRKGGNMQKMMRQLQGKMPGLPF
ncbi:signal recognition particle protein [Ectothiorhodospiraceae bacterium BW-2]|nr:signal recognition particle protein [Ectothiorhodospiraceae bacterium BW-2]